MAGGMVNVNRIWKFYWVKSIQHFWQVRNVTADFFVPVQRSYGWNSFPLPNLFFCLCDERSFPYRSLFFLSFPLSPYLLMHLEKPEFSTCFTSFLTLHKMLMKIMSKRFNMGQGVGRKQVRIFWKLSYNIFEMTVDWTVLLFSYSVSWTTEM